jgi:hypothetical protein
MPVTKAASAAFVVFGAGASDPVGRILRMLRALGLALALARARAAAARECATHHVPGRWDLGAAQGELIVKSVD